MLRCVDRLPQSMGSRIPALGPSAQPAAAQNRSRRFCLAKAFRGELVPQDPSDEPASVLLARIQAQRASAPKARRGRRVGAD
ncbi:MAG: hypothetical protein NDI93_09435 [Pseudomonas sp.]|nr:hypothetical protein [Pseudomonas sp.]